MGESWEIRPLEGVRLGRAHEAVDLLLLARLVVDLDRGADGDHVRRHVLLADDLRGGEDGLQLLDAALHEGLLLARLVILRVFGKVAEGAGDLDLLGHLAALDGAQVVQLLLHLLDAFGGKVLDVAAVACHEICLLNST